MNFDLVHENGANSVIFGQILLSAVRAQFLGGSTHLFPCYPIIVYILGSYHGLPLNPDFWVDLRAQMIAPPSR